MTVAKVQQEGLELRHLTLSCEHPYPFGYGQYCEVGLPGEKPGYFAIASAPEASRQVEFLVKDGNGAAHDLYEVSVGDTVQVGAPMGPGFPKEHLLGKNVLLIGVGSGMAPLRSVVGSVLANREDYGERVMLIYGARTPFHIPFRPEIAKWRGKLEVYKAMSQPGDADWDGYVGYVQHLIEDIDVPRGDTLACVCGMSPMVEAVKEKLAEMGIAEDDVYLNF
jgi:NAD(P)H-flavin reductase